MTKKLSKREKILLAVLIVIVAILLWYKFAYEPINKKIDQLNSQAMGEQAEIDSQFALVESMRRMQKTVEELKADETTKAIPIYDNSKQLMVSLNSVMESADAYALTFNDVSQDDYILSRTITMTFTTSTYEDARAIIDRLDEETFTNQISDVKVYLNTSGSSKVLVELTITYFEVEG